MGMYTSFRGRVIVKKEYMEEIQMLMDNEFDWDKSNYEFMREFSKLPRADFLFNGPGYDYDLSNDDEFNHQISKEKRGMGFNTYMDKETQIFSFNANFKNYDHEIEHFIMGVLINIIEDIIVLEEKYEEWYDKYKSYTYDKELNIINTTIINEYED